MAAALWGLAVKKRSRLTSAFWLSISVGNTAFLYTLNAYAHYGICLLPLFYLALCELSSPCIQEKMLPLSKGLALCMAAVALLSAGLRAYKDFTVQLPPSAYEDIVDYGDDYSSLVAQIPEEGRQNFVAFNENSIRVLSFDPDNVNTAVRDAGRTVYLHCPV